MRKQSAIAPILLSVLLALSCANATLGKPADTSSGLSDPTKGKVSISIPTLGAAFLRYAAEFADGSGVGEGSRGLVGSPRAFIAASSARLEFFAQGSTAAFYSCDVELSANAVADEAMGSNSYASCSATLPVGIGYTAKVTLYNKANGVDAASRATVSGVSASFDISSRAETPISITCLPIDPEPLALGVESAAATLVPYEGSYYSGMTIGSEKWYKLTADSRQTRILARASKGSRAVLALFVFDSKGKACDSSGGGSASYVVSGSGNAAYLDSVSGDTYYVAVVDVGTSLATYHSEVGVFKGGEHGFVLSFADAAADSLEADGTMAKAGSLELGKTQEHSIYPAGDVDYLQLPVEAGQGYDISLVSVDSSRPNLEFSIVDLEGKAVAQNSSNGDSLDNIEQWVCPAEGGSYYLRIQGAADWYSTTSSVVGAYGINVTANGAPQNLAVVPGSADPYHSLLVTWSGVGNAAKYRLYSVTKASDDDYSYSESYSISPFTDRVEAEEVLSILYEGADMSFLRTGLKSGYPFSYRVSAFVDGAWTPLSAIVAGTTTTETSVSISLQ